MKWQNQEVVVNYSTRVIHRNGKYKPYTQCQVNLPSWNLQQLYQTRTIKEQRNGLYYKLLGLWLLYYYKLQELRVPSSQCPSVTYRASMSQLMFFARFNSTCILNQTITWGLGNPSINIHTKWICWSNGKAMVPWSRRMPKKISKMVVNVSWSFMTERGCHS